MRKFLKKRAVIIAAVLALSLACAQCGYIMYPERKGTESGKIDVEVLVLDCLWLIVGIVPGVVALVVDFATGCIYEPGTTVGLSPGDQMAFRLRDPAPVDASVSVAIQKDGAEVATIASHDFEKGEVLDELSMAIPENIEPGAYKLAIKVNGKASSTWDLEISE